MKRSKEMPKELHLRHKFTPKDSHIAYRDFTANRTSKKELLLPSWHAGNASKPWQREARRKSCFVLLSKGCHWTLPTTILAYVGKMQPCESGTAQAIGD